MTERIRVVPANLRQAAEQHRQAADYLATMPSSHGAIQASLDSLGPIYSGLREAGRQLLDERARCYAEQSDDHAEMARNLIATAELWEQHEQDAAAKFRGLVEEQVGNQPGEQQ